MTALPMYVVLVFRRKQPTAGSLSAGAQAALERAFPGGAGSALCRYAAPAGARPCALVECARLYRVRGAPPHDLAAHNAHVARTHNRHMVSAPYLELRGSW